MTWKWREAVRERKQCRGGHRALDPRLAGPGLDELDPLAKNLTVRELLDRTRLQLGGWLDGQPEVEAQIRETSAAPTSRSASSTGRSSSSALRFGSTSSHRGPDDREHAARNNLLATLLDRTGRGAEAERSAPPQPGRLPPGPRSRRPGNPRRRRTPRLGPLASGHDEAEAVLRKNVDDRSRVLKPEHADTLRSVYLLSRLLRERRQFDEARELAYRYAHSVQCSMGSNHPDCVLALTNQGDVLRDQKKLTEAEVYYRRAAEEARRIFGPDHRSTLAAVSNHAKVLGELGRSGNQ